MAQTTSFVVTPKVVGKTSSSTRADILSRKAALCDYGPAAASLFNNMKLPASIIGGAMIPIGFAAPLKFEADEGDGKFAIFLRKFYPFIAVLSLCSELLSVMWATVAVNQLTENEVAAASSVWALIHRDFALPWAATNAHFVMGMLGFIWVISSRVYFIAAKGGLGASAAGMAMSAMMLITSIVNRGVAAGGGGNMRFGGSILALLRTYTCLLLKRSFSLKSFGVLEIGAVGLAIGCLFNTLRIIFRDLQEVKD